MVPSDNNVVCLPLIHLANYSIDDDDNDDGDDDDDDDDDDECDEQELRLLILDKLELLNY